jgi:hypothetical protein
MKAVTETATGRALWLFDDATDVRITDRAMESPVVAFDIRASTHSAVNVPQPDIWVGGGALAWNGEAWEIADQEAYDAALAALQPAIAFPTISRRQLRLGLLSIGVTADDVEAEIATIADAQERAAALIEWQDASAYERDHPLIAQVADALGLPAEQVDDLWLWAAGI